MAKISPENKPSSPISNPTQKFPRQHEWNLTPEEASQLQDKLRSYVKVEPLPLGAIHTVAGVDASFDREVVCAAAAVFDFSSLQVVEEAVAETSLTFPYIPGLLSFREAPGILSAINRLSALPDVLIVDGHGLAHPRRFGLACHLGVWLDIPTIGCAKSILVGDLAPLGEKVGSTAQLTLGDEVLGVALRTREKVKPVYLSIGHRMDLESAVQIITACRGGYRLPEPARQAHFLAKEACRSRVRS
jgi:deoxyribonuclease V